MRRLLTLLVAAAFSVGLAVAPLAPASADSGSVSGTGWTATVTVPDVAWTGLACQKFPFTVKLEGTVTEWGAYLEAMPIGAKKTTLKGWAEGMGAGEVSATFTKTVCPTPKTLGQYAAAAGIAVMAPGMAEPEMRIVAVNFTVGPAAPVAKVTTNKGASKMRVDVDPNLGAKYWKFTVERKSPDGTTWIPLKTYKTLGSKERRNINLPAGTYRVHVLPKYGFTESWSNEVVLTK
jgi:hypothetical protein